MSRVDKNAVLPLRFVCRSFDIALKPWLFKTIQLDFSRLLRIKKGAIGLDGLSEVGQLASAVYIDMMVIRDEGQSKLLKICKNKIWFLFSMFASHTVHKTLTYTLDEIYRLNEAFHGFNSRNRETAALIESLRKYCLNENTFEGDDFRRVVNGILNASPNANRLRLNLPFQMVGRANEATTLLLANAFACIANRDEELPRIETLVLDHVSDKTINDIFNNHMDVLNAFKTFESLKHVVLSIKRQESRQIRQNAFCQNFWLLMKKATFLETLCLIGWNIKRDPSKRHHSPREAHPDEWDMRSLPYIPLVADIDAPLTPCLRALRCLELKRVDIKPECFLRLIAENCHSLKELYLNEVYLKVVGIHSLTSKPIALWIGHAKSPKAPWIAHRLSTMEGLNLEILRATGLGYDHRVWAHDSEIPNYDLDDPTTRKRSFDERFVTAAIGQDELYSWMCNEALKTPYPLDTISPSMLMTNTPSSMPPSPGQSLTMNQYDAETYQRYHNPTSQYKRCIDGVFFNHNEFALRELQRIIEVADRGMSVVSAGVERRIERLDGRDELMDATTERH